MDLNQQGLLDDNSTERVRGLVEAKMKKLGEMPPWVQLPSKEHSLRAIPWMRDLDAASFKIVHDHAVEHVIARDTTFITQGEVGHSVYVIARGVCDIETQSPHSHYSNFSKQVQHVGMGSTIGDATLLTGVTQGNISVKAHTTVLVFQLHNQRMRDLLSSQPTLLANLWRHAAIHLAWPIFTEMPQYTDQNLDADQLKDKAMKWTLFTVRTAKGAGSVVWGDWQGGGRGEDVLECMDATANSTTASVAGSASTSGTNDLG
jgi:hypothetical protein